MRVLLVAYGCIIAVLGGAWLDRGLTETPLMMPTRDEGIRASLMAIDEGQPPLVATGRQHLRAQRGLGLGSGALPQLDTSARYALPRGDFVGPYLYLPLLGHLLAEDDPRALIRLLYIFLFSTAALIYPLLFFEIFRSVLAGVLAPLLLFSKLDVFAPSDLYWVNAWIVIIGVPAAVVCTRRLTRVRVVGCCAIAATAGFASSIRQAAGLAIVAAAIALVGVARSPVRRRALLGATVAAVYVGTASGVVAAVETYRDWKVDGPLVARGEITGWHTAYIGLGYLDNPYGIRYLDENAHRAARRERPGVAYLGDGYGDALRTAFLRIARTDPGFIAEVYAMKARALAIQVWNSFGVGIILLPLVLSIGRTRRMARRCAVVTICAAVAGAVQPLVALPQARYSMSWLAGWFLLWVLAATWASATLARLATAVQRLPAKTAVARARLMIRRDVASGRWWVFGGAATAAIVGLVASAPASSRLDGSRSFFRAGASPLEAPISGARVVSWPFDGRLPRHWSRVGDVRVASGARSVIVTTTDQKLAYQLQSPIRRLVSGRYVASVDGSVRAGGIGVGALEVADDAWLKVALHWFGQPFDRRTMAVRFTLREPTTVRIILSNWQPKDRPSTWSLRRVTIFRVR